MTCATYTSKVHHVYNPKTTSVRHTANAIWTLHAALQPEVATPAAAPAITPVATPAAAPAATQARNEAGTSAAHGAAPRPPA